MCDHCASEHRQDSRERYRLGRSLFEDDYEIPYNAVNDRYYSADYEMTETIGEYAKGSRWTAEDMVLARSEGDLPSDTLLINLRSGNYTTLGMVEEIEMSEYVFFDENGVKWVWDQLNYRVVTVDTREDPQSGYEAHSLRQALEALYENGYIKN